MKSVFSKVVVGALILIVAGFGLTWLFGNGTERPTDLPWQIEILPDGSSRVFRVHLGVTRLQEFVRTYKEAPEISLFVQASGQRVIEAYFDQIVMGGLKAKVVLSFMFDAQTLEGIYSRGARISTLPDGTRKVELSSTDLAAMADTAITGITYIPSINVEAATISKRFGEPANRITDKNTGAVHWLYPEKGLDVALNETGKEIFQYVNPGEFARLIEPLNSLTP